jgi:hypothetical protein
MLNCQNEVRFRFSLMRKTSVWWIMMALAIGGAALHGQETSAAVEQRQDQLAENLRLIRIAVSMDRTTPYFPGEEATVTVTLTNPTSAPLEVTDPRAPDMASFAYSTKGGFGTKDDSEWSRFDAPKPQLSFSDPTTVVQPGQSITMVFPPTQSARPYPTFTAVPTYPGAYRVRFRLGGEVEFEVGKPVLEASAIVPLQQSKTHTRKDSKDPETFQEAAEIVAVQLNGVHLLFAGLHNVSTVHELPDPANTGIRWVYGLEPWVRVAAAPSKVKKLSGTADPSGQITLEYTHEDGGGGKAYLDKTRHPLGAQDAAAPKAGS